MALTARKIYQHKNKHRINRKQNKYISNKPKILNTENGRPNNCITEKYLQNDKYIGKRKKDNS